MTKMVKIFRLSTGGFFLSNEEEMCKLYCKTYDCTYSVDYIPMAR